MHIMACSSLSGCCAASQSYCAELVVPNIKLVGTCRITLSSLKVDCHSDKDPEVSDAYGSGYKHIALQPAQ